MLKNNLEYNASVTSNTAFLESLREKLPEFFTADKNDENGAVTSRGTFDFEKFKRTLTENSIQNELTSGYQLNFIGKDYAKKQAGEVPTTVVLPDKFHNEQIENQNSQNLFFTGDNLEVLRHLQAGYENSIDVIYIDPPYNTGSDGFIYPDKFEYSDAKLQTMFGLNDEELERLKSIQGKATHSAWLTFMYPRLWLAKRLLKETGIIFVSIDDNEQTNLKLLMDEIFGEGNFISNVVWENKEGGGKSDSKFFKNKHEYIVVYARNIGLSKINGVAVEDIDRYKETDEHEQIRGKFQLIKLDSGSLGWSKSLDYPITPELLKNLGWKENVNQTFYPGSDKEKWKIRQNGDHAIKDWGWRWSKAKLKWGIENDFIVIKNGNIYTKQYLNVDKDGNIKSRTNQPIAVIDRYSTTQSNKQMKTLFNGTVPFTYSKPVDLISYLLQLSTEPNSTILDFFAGSSTTAHAVMKLNSEDGGNRNFVMVTLPEKLENGVYKSIDEISRERIKRASQKIREERGTELPEEFDGGFKHYRVLEPSQATLDDLDSFDIETGGFVDSKGNHLLLSENSFEDMITPFSSQSLGFDTGATGIDTILATWMLADGYSILNRVETLNFASYTAFYLNSERLYLIADNWESEQTKLLVNLIGSNEKVIQTIVLYGYSFSLESLRELELALAQLDTKINLVKRY